MSSFLTLPMEINQQILQYALRDYKQIVSICAYGTHKRACLTRHQSIREKRQPAGDAKLQLLLVNKRLAAETLKIKPQRICLIAYSTSSLRTALSSNMLDNYDKLKHIVICQRLRLPVDICKLNYELLQGTANSWIRRTCVDFYEIIWDAGYSVDILKTVEESYFTLEKERSTTEQHFAFRVS